MEKFYVWAIFLGRAYCSCFRALQFFHTNFTYALAFAAGAMIFVVVEEVIPETQQDNNTDIATMGSLGIYCYDGLGCCSC
jgi:zinc transporter ZupT